jgi:acyl-CoA thioesterase
MMSFSSLCATMTADADGLALTVPGDWMQGRTIYGGLSAALCLEAALRSFPDLPPLRSALVSFIGPGGGDLRLAARLLRRGKSAAFVEADIVSEGQLATRATFCFGAARPSTFAHQALAAPDVPGPQACTPFFKSPLRPAFTQHFDMRLAGGHAPMSGAAEPDMILWARHEDAESRSGLVALLALADAAPPAAMAMFTAPAMISSMTWMVDVLDPAALSAEGWWLCRSTAQTARDGYSAQAMTLWAADGTPVLVGRQTIAVFG